MSLIYRISGTLHEPFFEIRSFYREGIYKVPVTDMASVPRREETELRALGMSSYRSLWIAFTASLRSKRQEIKDKIKNWRVEIIFRHKIMCPKGIRIQIYSSIYIIFYR